MADLIYPDAYVKDGVIRDIKTDDELPSFCGICLANLAGRWAVMYITHGESGRKWEFVHWGAPISAIGIQEFMKRDKRVEGNTT